MIVKDILESHKAIQKAINNLETKIVCSAKIGTIEELKALTEKLEDMQTIRRRLLRTEIPENTDTVNLYNILDEIDNATVK